MNPAKRALPLGRRVSLPGHFEVAEVLEVARPLGVNGCRGYESRVRHPDGTSVEAVISPVEAAACAALERHGAGAISPVDAEGLRHVTQALAGRALSGGTEDVRGVIATLAEHVALKKLLANWRALID